MPKPSLSLENRMNVCAFYFIKSGETSLGNHKGISGQMIRAQSTSNIGTSMIIVSFSANFIGTLATEQEIIKHKP